MTTSHYCRVLQINFLLKLSTSGWSGYRYNGEQWRAPLVSSCKVDYEQTQRNKFCFSRRKKIHRKWPRRALERWHFRISVKKKKNKKIQHEFEVIKLKLHKNRFPSVPHDSTLSYWRGSSSFRLFSKYESIHLEYLEMMWGNFSGINANPEMNEAQLISDLIRERVHLNTIEIL